MNGRGHLAAGAAVLLDGAALGAMHWSGMAPEALRRAGDFVVAHMSPWHALGGGLEGAIGCAAGLGLYFLGLLLPDLDLKESTLSHLLHVHLPMRHRGWTHSVWALALAFAGSAFYMPVLWLALGMLAHDLADSLSQAGWVPFYPLGRWKTYHDTVMRRGWTPGLYSSSRPGSEEAVCGILSALCVALAGVLLYIGFWPKGG